MFVVAVLVSLSDIYECFLWSILFDSQWYFKYVRLPLYHSVPKDSQIVAAVHILS